MWYENIDGKGTYGPERVVATNIYRPRDLIAADMDNDGDFDLVSIANDGIVAWHENTDGHANFGGNKKIITTKTIGPRGAYAADIDLDGDMDIVTVSRNDNKVAWYENIDGKGTLGRSEPFQLMPWVDTACLQQILTATAILTWLRHLIMTKK